MKAKFNCRGCGRIIWLEDMHERLEEICSTCQKAICGAVFKKSGGVFEAINQATKSGLSIDFRWSEKSFDVVILDYRKQTLKQLAHRHSGYPDDENLALRINIMLQQILEQ